MRTWKSMLGNLELIIHSLTDIDSERILCRALLLSVGPRAAGQFTFWGEGVEYIIT